MVLSNTLTLIHVHGQTFREGEVKIWEANLLNQIIGLLNGIRLKKLV